MDDYCQNAFQEIKKNLGYLGCQDVRHTTNNNYDVRGSFDTKNKHGDGDDDDIMMLITKIHHMLRNVDHCAGRIISTCSQKLVSRC